jgi:predicted small lipoprotein YifL
MSRSLQATRSLVYRALPARSQAALTRRALLAGLAAAPLAACGIRGPNKRPEDSDPAYPRTYPPPDSVRPEGRRAPQEPAEGEQDGQ